MMAWEGNSRKCRVSTDNWRAEHAGAEQCVILPTPLSHGSGVSVGKNTKTPVLANIYCIVSCLLPYFINLVSVKFGLLKDKVKFVVLFNR